MQMFKYPVRAMGSAYVYGLYSVSQGLNKVGFGYTDCNTSSCINNDLIPTYLSRKYINGKFTKT